MNKFKWICKYCGHETFTTVLEVEGEMEAFKAEKQLNGAS